MAVRASTRLRELLEGDRLILTPPGVYDGISARLALEAGFDTLYMSGAATTASMLGQPDLAVATQNDFIQNATMIANLAPGVPVICDADTGFGGPVMVSRTLAAYARAGVAGFHIEDQLQTKRCGHLLGKQIAPKEEFIARIRAAAAARAKIPGCDIVIIARTDAAQSFGMEDALDRLKAAIELVMVCVVAFLEGVRNKEEVSFTVSRLAPTPVIFPLVTAIPATHAIRAALHSLKTTGSDVPTAGGMGPKAFFEVMGLDEAIQIDMDAGGAAFTTI
ncbi:oxaloacetate Acetylhydrolase [Cyathus striatus]|nr:oxaloacetate Acetylhydrolase [Cyathus striatus]